MKARCLIRILTRSAARKRLEEAVPQALIMGEVVYADHRMSYMDNHAICRRWAAEVERLEAIEARVLALPGKWRDGMSKTNDGLGADLAIAYEDSALESCASDLEDALGIGHPPRPAESSDLEFPRATIRMNGPA
jgi:hypothetical protein